MHWYSIAFGTRTKTAEPIEMPFAMMTEVGRRYFVRWGTRSPKAKGPFLRENAAAHCKLMGHSIVSCAKTAEPIDIPFWIGWAKGTIY